MLLPGEHSSKLVRKYLFLNTTESNKIISDRYIPDGSVSIIINSDRKVWYSWNRKKTQLPSRFLVIPMRESLIIEAHAPLKTMVIICKASVFSRLFSVSLNELTSLPYRMWPHNDFFERLFMMPLGISPKEKVKYVENLISRFTSLADYKADAIDTIYESIYSGDNNGPLSQIARKYDLDERTFRRHFLNRVGINAKCLYRIVRIHSIWDIALTSGGDKPDLFDLMYNGGFFDQSHFINDFKKIVGETPLSFFHRNQERVCFISGKDIFAKHAIDKFEDRYFVAEA